MKACHFLFILLAIITNVFGSFDHGLIFHLPEGCCEALIRVAESRDERAKRYAISDILPVARPMFQQGLERSLDISSFSDKEKDIFVDLIDFLERQVAISISNGPGTNERLFYYIPFLHLVKAPIYRWISLQDFSDNVLSIICHFSCNEEKNLLELRALLEKNPMCIFKTKKELEAKEKHLKCFQCKEKPSKGANRFLQWLQSLL